jgi:preprotein translocase subunit SecE
VLGVRIPPGLLALRGNGENMKIAKYFKESWGELKKVSWPKKDEVVHYTWIVIISTIVFAIVLGLVDIGIGQLMDLIF